VSTYLWLKTLFLLGIVVTATNHCKDLPSKISVLSGLMGLLQTMILRRTISEGIEKVSIFGSHFVFSQENFPWWFSCSFNCSEVLVGW
jgi:hypothetical protein